jgi:hypothetical protein
MDDYYFLKKHYPLTNELLFQQHIFETRVELRNYLINFLYQKQDGPLYSLSLYMQGKKDLCIQSVGLNDMDKDFETDFECYSFLTKYMYSDEQVKNGKDFLKFVENQIEILNLKFTDKALATNQYEFTEFQKQLTIFANEI